MLLSCYGLKVDRLSVPRFDIAEREVVGLAVEAEFGESVYELQKILGGAVAHPEVIIACKAVTVFPRLLRPQGSSPLIHNVRDFILAEGVNGELAQDLINRVGLTGDAALGSVQLTDRMLIKLGIARALGTRLVVFSSAGFDPTGFARVLEDVFLNVESCSALDLFALQPAQPMNWYNRVVCGTVR